MALLPENCSGLLNDQFKFVLTFRPVGGFVDLLSFKGRALTGSLSPCEQPELSDFRLYRQGGVWSQLLFGQIRHQDLAGAGSVCTASAAAAPMALF